MPAVPKPPPKGKKPRQRMRQRTRLKSYAGTYGPEWPAVRDAVLVRDGGVCKIPGCGIKTKEVHHVTPYAIVRRHEMGNLLALCWRHHRHFDVRPEFRAYLYRLIGGTEETHGRRPERVSQQG